MGRLGNNHSILCGTDYPSGECLLNHTLSKAVVVVLVWKNASYTFKLLEGATTTMPGEYYYEEHNYCTSIEQVSKH